MSFSMDYFRHQQITLVTPQTPDTISNSSFSLPAVDPNVSGISTLLCLAMFLLVLPFQIYVFRLIVTGAGTRIALEFFLLNLCVCQFIISFSAIPYVVYILKYRNIVPNPFFALCIFLFSLHMIGRPFFQCCISVERYLAVVHPVLFLKYKPLRYRLAISAMVWFIVVGFSVLSALVPSRSMLYYIILPQYVLFFSVIVLCSVAVLMTLRKLGLGKKVSAKESESNDRKIKAFSMISIILVLMAVTNGPVVVFICLYDSLSDLQKWNAMLMFSYLLAIVGFLQPFLYLYKVGKLPFVQRS